MTTLKAHAWPLVFLLIVCALAATFKIGVLGTAPNSDYVDYISTAKIFSGLPAPIYPQRILKPLAPLGVALAAPYLGFPTAFLLEVLIFYFAFVLVLYWLAYSFFEDYWRALVAALLGALSYPLLRYGLDLYTETGAQFFYLLSLVFTLLYIRWPLRKHLVLNGAVIAIGLLWKEYSVVAGIIFGFVLLFENVPWRARIKNLALLALITLVPTLAVQVWVYFAYHYTYLTWYTVGAVRGFTTQFTLQNLIKSTIALLGLAWFLVPVGIWHLPELPAAQRRFLAFALPSSLIVFGWGLSLEPTLLRDGAGPAPARGLGTQSLAALGASGYADPCDTD